MSELDVETFNTYVGHRDNATHFKSSGNLWWWSQQQDERKADFMRKIILEFACPGKGKGPWDGIGAVVKTKIRNEIVNDICKKIMSTKSGRIISAVEVCVLMW